MLLRRQQGVQPQGYYLRIGCSQAVLKRLRDPSQRISSSYGATLELPLPNPSTVGWGCPSTPCNCALLLTCLVDKSESVRKGGIGMDTVIGTCKITTLPRGLKVKGYEREKRSAGDPKMVSGPRCVRSRRRNFLEITVMSD